MSFIDFLNRFNISKSNLFRYFQLLDFAKTHLSSFPYHPHKTIKEDIMSSPITRRHTVYPRYIACYILYNHLHSLASRGKELGSEHRLEYRLLRKLFRHVFAAV